MEKNIHISPVDVNKKNYTIAKSWAFDYSFVLNAVSWPSLMTFDLANLDHRFFYATSLSITQQSWKFAIKSQF